MIKIYPKVKVPMRTEGLKHFATKYAKRANLNEDVIPHLTSMLVLGGGKIPTLETRQNMAPVNIYEGNQEYENCVVELDQYEENPHYK